MSGRRLFAVTLLVCGSLLLLVGAFTAASAGPANGAASDLTTGNTELHREPTRHEWGLMAGMLGVLAVLGGTVTIANRDGALQ